MLQATGHNNGNFFSKEEKKMYAVYHGDKNSWENRVVFMDEMEILDEGNLMVYAKHRPKAHPWQNKSKWINYKIEEQWKINTYRSYTIRVLSATPKKIYWRKTNGRGKKRMNVSTKHAWWTVAKFLMPSTSHQPLEMGKGYFEFETIWTENWLCWGIRF